MQRRKPKQKILVVDVGGSHVKCVATGHMQPLRFKSGPTMTAWRMVKTVLELTRAWDFDVVSIGYPGVIRDNRILREPHNLGTGWVRLDMRAAFGRPIKLINDAAMQALGDYKRGKMLFLGLGTGLGAALIVEGAIAAMELGHLPCDGDKTYEYFLGDAGRKRLGNKKWRARVSKVVEEFRNAFLPDEIVIGGGNAARLKKLPPHTRRGLNTRAFLGGFRLWNSETPRNAKR